MKENYAIVVHGGAGTITPDKMNPEIEAGYRNALQEAVSAGYESLEKGGTAIEAVEAATIAIENNPHFNAGRGSVFTHEGKIEMDASIMDGKTLLAGAVSGIKNVKNPITLARTVMEKSEHVFLCGKGAEEFAKFHNLEFAPDEYFFTHHRHNQLLMVRDSNKSVLDHISPFHDEKKFGTGGAVALDKYGNIAAATSTGGMTNKMFGRIGDSPIIGAGTYANNNTCAISCTGHGEYFIRAVVAYDVSCLMEYKKMSLEEACTWVVYEKLLAMSGEGGLIAIDTQGNISTPFNSAGMYRGFRKAGMEPVIGIYRERLDRD